MPALASTTPIVSTKGKVLRFGLALSLYQFRFRVLQSEQLEQSPGIIWRSKLGNALRRLSCIARQEQCEGCRFKGACAYGQLFEHCTDPFVATTSHINAPSPYIISAFHEPNLVKREVIEVNLILVGLANVYYEHMIAAMEQVAHWGLTEQSNPLQLESILQQLPNGQSHILYDGEYRQSALPPEEGNVPPPCKFLRIELVTPTRIFVKKKLCSENELNAAIFCQAVIRRVAEMSRFWAGGCVDQKESLQQAMACQTLDKELTMKLDRRFSKSQHQSLSLNGIVGDIFCQLTEARNFWPALWLGQWINVGKSSVMGYGHYRIEMTDHYRSFFETITPD